MNPSGPESASRALVIPFVVLHTFVWVALTIVILTVVLSRHVKRQIVWLSLNLSWIVTCFSFSLLFNTGQLFKSVPDKSICLVQAVATTTFPSLTSGTTLAFALNLWFNIRSCSYRAEPGTAMFRIVALVVIPWIIPLAAFLAVFMYGAQHPEQVHLDGIGMLCGLTNTVLAKLSAISVSMIMFITAIFEAWTMWMIYRRQLMLKTGISSIATNLLRLSVFTLFGIVGMVAGLTYLSGHGTDEAVANLLQALPPVSFVFIFGLQRDIFQAWMFWRKDDLPTLSNQSEGTEPETKV
ncbi:hypothetical protein VKT23_019631 [Stygiomarasmius scandens]|uniref:Uncharacterized protein n=1 Tax=Marasmiellus scandens TaxID=2682957 RepID=A0ABR1IP71_9AGAR